MAWCLSRKLVDDFKKALRNGEIDPFKLATMESLERRTFLEKYVGKENAVQTNSLFESKLLLKNQKAGYISWAKKVAGLTTEAKRDLISRIERLDTVLNPKEEQAFLNDLASSRLGVEVTRVEAKTISDLSQKVQEAKTIWDTKYKKEIKNDPSYNWRDAPERLNWGATKGALGKYIADLKTNAGKIGLLERGNPKNYLNDISEISGIAKSTKASLDVSYIFRQGWKTMFTHPGQWLLNSARGFKDFVNTLKNRDQVLEGVMADINSRPYYDEMVKAKLAIGTIEEAFPTKIQERIPVLGRFFQASDTAFTAFAYRQRADIFESYLDIAKKSGLDISDPKQLIGIGKIVNSLTGRGDLGRLEPAANTINNVFFSPRFLKSNIDILTAHAFDKGITPFARKMALINTAKVITGTAAVLLIARSINKNSVETDPTSSDFGKIKIGNTRFDVSGGTASILTLAMRELTQSSKSSTTGKVSMLNSGVYGSQTGSDVVVNFFQNKLSPSASIIKDLLNQKDFNGNKPTVLGELNNLLMPLPITTYAELKNDPKSAPILLGMLADIAGISTNTYGKSTTDWTKSTSKEIIQFTEKYGVNKLKEANTKYNTKFDEWSQKIYRNTTYQNMSDEDKQKVIDQAKAKIKADIFKQYRFKVKTVKQTPSQKRTIKRLLP